MRQRGGYRREGYGSHIVGCKDYRIPEVLGRTSCFESALCSRKSRVTYCWATPVRRDFDSHRRPRLPTAPATAACHRLSPSSPSRSGGPKVGRTKKPLRKRRRKYDKGGASRRRWSVRVFKKVNVPIPYQNMGDRGESPTDHRTEPQWLSAKSSMP